MTLAAASHHVVNVLGVTSETGVPIHNSQHSLILVLYVVSNGELPLIIKHSLPHLIPCVRNDELRPDKMIVGYIEEPHVSLLSG